MSKIKKTKVRACRICGCTEADCSSCIDLTGDACHWVAPDLCSACEPIADLEAMIGTGPLFDEDRDEWRRRLKRVLRLLHISKPGVKQS